MFKYFVKLLDMKTKLYVHLFSVTDIYFQKLKQINTEKYSKQKQTSSIFNQSFSVFAGTILF